jgi:hypothetical protein
MINGFLQEACRLIQQLDQVAAACARDLLPDGMKRELPRGAGS